MANNFEAIIKARLDTSGVEKQIKNEINSRQVNLHNVTVNTANLIQQIQNALNSNTFQINVNSANVQNSIRQMGNMGQSVGRQFVQGFNRELNNIHLVNGGIGNVRNMLQGAGFDKNSINAITQDLNRMVLAIDEVQTRQLSNGNISIRITGVDELNRGVQIIREFDKESGNIVNTSKTFTQTFEQRKRAVKEFNTTLEKAQTAMRQGDIGAAISSVQKQYSQLETSGHQSLGAISTDLTELYRLQTELCRAADDQALVQNYERYNEVLNRVRNSLKIVSNETKMFATTTEVATLQNRMEAWLINNSRASKTYGETIRQLITELNSLNSNGRVPETELKRIASAFREVDTAASAAGLKGKTFIDSLKRGFQSISRYISSATIIYKTIAMLKEMYQNVLKIDTAMTGLRRVTNLTGKEYEKLFDKMTESAKKYGSTLEDIINSTASWVRLGFDADTSEKLSEVTAMYQHVTDLDNSTAVENLVTAYKGYQDKLLEATNGNEVKAMNRIADIYDKLGNEMPVTAAQVGEGMTRAASILEMSGATLEEASGMITGGGAVTQDFDAFATALKVSALRVRGMKGQLEELGEEVDENVVSVSKMQTQILNLTSGKVNIFEEDGETFRNIYDIYADISKIYDELSDTDRASLLELIAGKNRANQIQALITHWGDVEKATTKAYKSEGTAAQENEKYMNSMQGKIDATIASWQALSNSVLSSDALKGLIDSGRTILDIVNAISKTIFGFPVLIATISGALSATKNIGRDKMFSLNCGNMPIVVIVLFRYKQFRCYTLCDT